MKSLFTERKYIDLTEVELCVNQYRFSTQRANSEQSFYESIAFVKRVISELFRSNNDKLINLLSYDAYKFFMESQNDVETIDSIDGCLEMCVKNKQAPGFINGSLTEAHYLDGAYYGRFQIEYVAFDGTKVSRSFKFDNNELYGNKLFISNSINNEKYLETIYTDGDKLRYHIEVPGALFTTTSAEIELLIDSYIKKGAPETIKYIFPEVYNKEYFQELSGVSKTKK